MKDILYCEDNFHMRKQIVGFLGDVFPDREVVADESVRGVLSKFTEINLDNVSPISVNNVADVLRRENADFSNLKLAITDGHLIDRFAGAGDEILSGWDLAKILRDCNYIGKIVYLGGSDIPSDREELFDLKLSKLDVRNGSKLIDYALTFLS